MANKLETAKGLSEVVKNCLTIAAIVVGGFWTYDKFIKIEAPALESRPDYNSQLSWDDLGDNKCDAKLNVQLKNAGISSFDVVKFRVRGWTFERKKVVGQSATYFDVNEIQRAGDIFFDRTYADEGAARATGMDRLFKKHYPPGDALFHTFEWLIDKDEARLAFFTVDFYLDAKGKQLQISTNAWDQICGRTESQPSTKGK